MSKRSGSFRALLSITAAFLMVSAVFAGQGDVASFSQNESFAQWQPLVDHDGLVLRVSGPSGVFTYAFDQGSAATLEPFDKYGYSLEDGTYAWELQANPRFTRSQRDALEHARGDQEALRRLEVEGVLPSRGSMTQSGYFTIQNGRFIVETAEREAGPGTGGIAAESNGPGGGLNASGGLVAQDQVILDDLIVDGSICAGFDCVNGESFGFDTIRIKENNLRIRAQDTSTSASFPTNDWMLTFNDSSNGGANKFSIDDIDGGRTPFTIEAGAPSHSLYVDDGGRIGFGTSTPVADLHVKSGNTPTLRLEQDGTSGFQAQTWDLAGNEANIFIRDASNGSTLPFRIFPGAPSNAISIEGSTGDVGLGTTSPTGELDIRGDGSSKFVFNPGAANTNVLELQNNAGTTMFTIFETGGGGAQFSMLDTGENERFRMTTTGGDNRMSGNLGLGCNGATEDLTVNSSTNAGLTTCGTGTESTISAGATQFTVTSSRTIKENLDPVEAEGILEKISTVGVYKYDFIEGPKDRLGLMAEDFHQIFERGSDTRLNGQEIQMAMWLAIQELSQKVSELEASIPE